MRAVEDGAEVGVDMGREAVLVRAGVAVAGLQEPEGSDAAVVEEVDSLASALAGIGRGKPAVEVRPEIGVFSEERGGLQGAGKVGGLDRVVLGEGAEQGRVEDQLHERRLLRSRVATDSLLCVVVAYRSVAGSFLSQSGGREQQQEGRKAVKK